MEACVSYPTVIFFLPNASIFVKKQLVLIRDNVPISSLQER